MAYNYLLELHELVAGRSAAAAAKGQRATEAGNLVEARFQEGRLGALIGFRSFLREHFDPKLPRRLREAMQRGETATDKAGEPA